MATMPTRRRPTVQPQSTAPATINQGTAQVAHNVNQASGGTVQAPALGSQPTVQNQTVNVNSGQMLKLVNSLAQAEMLKSGLDDQAMGEKMMYSPGGGKKDNYRNMFAGSLKAHFGRQDVAKALEMEDEANRQKQEAARLAQKQAMFEEQQKRGEAAQIIAQLQPQWTRDQVISAAAMVVAGRLDMKDIEAFGKEEAKERKTTNVTRMGPDGKTKHIFLTDSQTGETIKDLGPAELYEPPEEEKPDLPWSSTEIASARDEDKTLANTRRAVLNYRNFIEEKGIEPDLPFNREDAERMKSLHVDALMLMKDKYGLGALQEADRAVMEEGMPPGTPVGDWIKNIFGGRADAVLASLDETLAAIDADIADLESRFPADVLRPMTSQVYATKEEAEAALAAQQGTK